MRYIGFMFLVFAACAIFRKCNNCIKLNVLEEHILSELMYCTRINMFLNVTINRIEKIVSCERVVDRFL